MLEVFACLVKMCLFVFILTGTVTSASLNTTHPESLLHHTTSVRRSRTAWSYHFYPNETWYDMAVNLPCAVLLEEVHINLSSTSVGRKYM